MYEFSADRQRFIVTILIIILSVGAFLNFTYAVYRSTKTPSFKRVGPNQLINITRTPEEIRKLLYGNNPTIECGKQSHVNRKRNVRVIGGRPAVYGEFPWHALLSGNATTDITNTDIDVIENWCGGSVIGNRWILTAAHCVFDYKNTGIDKNPIYLGILDRASPNRSSVTYEMLFIHPDFNHSTRPNDIALIKTVQEIDLTGHIAPVCLPEPHSEPAGMATVSGFGSFYTGGPSPIVLQAATIPVLDDGFCAIVLALTTNESITESMICAGYSEGGVGSCPGDSGGALIQFSTNNRATVVGIVSWGDKACGKKDNPGIYTQVSHFVNWIYDTIDDNLL